MQRMQVKHFKASPRLWQNSGAVSAMTDRGKLIALTMCHCALITNDSCQKSSNGKCTIMDCATCLADHLIANGVVVREKQNKEETA